jgi:hypothetical protein
MVTHEAFVAAEALVIDADCDPASNAAQVLLAIHHIQHNEACAGFRR